MEHGRFWEANRFSAGQEISRISWNPKVRYRNCKSPPPAPVLSQISLVLASPSHFLKIHFNIILSFTSGLPTKTLHVLLFSHTYHMPRPSHSPWFDHTSNICWVHITKLLVLEYTSIFRLSLVPFKPKYLKCLTCTNLCTCFKLY